LIFPHNSTDSTPPWQEKSPPDLRFPGGEIWPGNFAWNIDQGVLKSIKFVRWDAKALRKKLKKD